jgi:DTW domain-containing protein
MTFDLRLVGNEYSDLFDPSILKLFSQRLNQSKAFSQINESHRNSRRMCWICRQPGAACYCRQIRPLDVGIEFVILIHPLEARRRIATGRMAHLILKNSVLIEGEDYSNCSKLQKILDDPTRLCLILYPGRDAYDLDLPGVKAAILDTVSINRKRLTVIVIDGTWATARKMMRLSGNLRNLGMVKFQPREESRFQVRKQPASHCLSTIEAIHTTIEILAPQEVRSAHDHLLEVFIGMVERQKKFVPNHEALPV